MAKLSTHVLDTANGIPAENMRVELCCIRNNIGKMAIVSAVTNADGRTDEPLLADEKMKKGIYEIHFFVSEYFQAKNNVVPSGPFLDIVPVRFSIFEENKNYHVPLLISPWAYSTYRGS